MRGSAHQDEGCSHISGTSYSGFRSSFLPSSRAVLSEVTGFRDQRITQFASPLLKRGFQVPAIILQKLSVASKGQGGGQAFPGWVPHPTAWETFLGPCLCSYLPSACSPTTGQQQVRSCFPLATCCTVEELSHSMSLLSPNMSHHREPSIVCETACSCNIRSLSTLQPTWMDTHCACTSGEGFSASPALGGTTIVAL